MGKAQAEPMPAAEAAAIINEVFGAWGGQSAAARELRRTVTTINRWCSGVTPVRSMEAVMLKLLLALHRSGVDWRGLLARGVSVNSASDLDDFI